MDPVFCAGSVAPDFRDIREFKDRTHFRDLPVECRTEALLKMARSIDLSDKFAYGAVFHLFADYTWDTGPQQAHRLSYSGDNWFMDYRREISSVGYKISRAYEWGLRIWEEMVKLPNETFLSVSDYPPCEVHDFLVRGRDSTAAEKVYTESFFTLEDTENYARDTVCRFCEFMKEV